MKKTLIKFVSYFMVGLLVMQAVFAVNGTNSKAAHSSKSTLYIAQNMELVRSGSADKSMVSILNDYVRAKHHAMFIKESGKSNYTTSYCIDFSKTAKSGGTLNADMQIDATQARLINYAMLYGFNSKTYNVTCGTKADTEHFFATQSLIWIIKTGNFYNDANRIKLENYFFKAWPGIKSKYQTIYQKVKYQDMLPSYANSSSTLKWNACSKKFEGTLTNTFTSGGNSANATVKVNTSSLPSGVQVTVSGEQVKITSTTEFTSNKVIKFTKAPNMKGKVVCWNVAVAGQQPQATLDYDMDPIAREFVINVKTDKKPVDPTPAPTVKPTPVPTQKPTCVPTQQPTCVPTQKPTCAPTQQPTCVPTQKPTCAPTQQPTCVPTQQPTCVPTQQPTCVPTETPTCAPTETPTCPPTETPSEPETPVCPEEPKVEVPEKTVEQVEVVTEDKLDEVPKTADSSNVNLIVMLLGAAVIAMVLSVAPIVVRKFRRY